MNAPCELTLIKDFGGETDEPKSDTLPGHGEISASSKIHSDQEGASASRFHRAAFHLRDRLRDKMKDFTEKSMTAGLEMIREFEDRTRKAKKKIREKMRIRYESGQVLACHITADEFAILVEKSRPQAVQFSRISSHWYSV